MILVSLDGVRTDFIRGLEHTILPKEQKQMGYNNTKIESLNEFVTKEPDKAWLFWLQVGENDFTLPKMTQAFTGYMLISNAAV